MRESTESSVVLRSYTTLWVSPADGAAAVAASFIVPTSAVRPILPKSALEGDKQRKGELADGRTDDIIVDLGAPV